VGDKLAFFNKCGATIRLARKAAVKNAVVNALLIRCRGDCLYHAPVLAVSNQGFLGTHARICQGPSREHLG
jgi:hypothetical protein